MAVSRGIFPYKLDENEEFYEQYYAVQRGSGFSVYSGRTVMPTYSADGNGIGGLFRSFLGLVRPLFTKAALKSGAKALGKSALGAGVQTVADISADRIKDAVFDYIKKAGVDLAQRARTSIREQQKQRKRGAAAEVTVHPPSPVKKKRAPALAVKRNPTPARRRRSKTVRRNVILGILES